VRQEERLWHEQDLQNIWLRLFQLADDVAILATTPGEMQVLLDVVDAWGRKRGLAFSTKSFAVLLSKKLRWAINLDKHRMKRARRAAHAPVHAAQEPQEWPSEPELEPRTPQPGPPTSPELRVGDLSLH
jgi:hypothetical protein